MKTAKKKKQAQTLPAFWDTSAIVPLCCYQAQSSQARNIVRLYGKQLVWWGTPVETVSSLNRLKREGALTVKQLGQSVNRLSYLRRRWHEIQPSEDLREIAERLLGAHKLRAADAFQLAAALVWTENLPRARHFISSDGALLTAAKAEGFSVIVVP